MVYIRLRPVRTGKLDNYKLFTYSMNYTPKNQTQALRFERVLRELDITNRFKITRIGREGKAGFRLYDYYRKHYPLICTGSLKSCYATFQKTVQEPQPPEGRQIYAQWVYTWNTPKPPSDRQLAYIVRLCQQAGRPQPAPMPATSCYVGRSENTHW